MEAPAQEGGHIKIKRVERLKIDFLIVFQNEYRPVEGLRPRFFWELSASGEADMDNLQSIELKMLYE